MVSGIEVFEPTNVVATAITDVQGNYALVAYGAGQYTVVQQPPAGWEQAAPSYSNPVFSPDDADVDGGRRPPSARTTAADDRRLQRRRADGPGGHRHRPTPRNARRYGIIVSVLYNQPDGSFKVEQDRSHLRPYTSSVPLARSATSTATTGPIVAFVHSGLLDARSRSNIVDVFLNTGDPTDPFNGFPNPMEPANRGGTGTTILLARSRRGHQRGRAGRPGARRLQSPTGQHGPDGVRRERRQRRPPSPDRQRPDVPSSRAGTRRTPIEQHRGRRHGRQRLPGRRPDGRGARRTLPGTPPDWVRATRDGGRRTGRTRSTGGSSGPTRSDGG